jgi:hypothetical protein
MSAEAWVRARVPRWAEFRMDYLHGDSTCAGWENRWTTLQHISHCQELTFHKIRHGWECFCVDDPLDGVYDVWSVSADVECPHGYSLRYVEDFQDMGWVLPEDLKGLPELDRELFLDHETIVW